MVYTGGIPERKTKMQHTPDVRGDQDNQDKSDFQGKKQAFYPKFFANQQHLERKTHLMDQSQASTACETSRSNPYQFSTFKSSPGRAVPADANSLDLSSLNLGHHEIGRKYPAYNSTRSRDHYRLPTSSRIRETSPNTMSRPLDKESYFFHGYKTEKDVNREVDELDGLGAVRGLDTFNGTNKRFSNSDKDNCFELNEKDVVSKKTEDSSDHTRKLSIRKKKKTYRSLDSLEKDVDFPEVDVRSLDLLPDDRPKTFFHVKQQSLDSTKPKKALNGTLPKASKPGLFQRIGRSFHFLAKENDKSQEYSRRENDLLTTNSPLTAIERCEIYCSQINPKDQVFLDGLPILRDGCEMNIPCQEPINERNGHNNANLKVKTNPSENQLEELRQREKNNQLMESMKNGKLRKEGQLNENHLNEENQSRIFQEASQKKCRNEMKSSRSSSDDKSYSSEKGVLTHETTSGNKDSLEIGYSISQLGRHCLQNSNNQEKMRSAEAMPCGESWERCLGWITKVDLDALSRGTNSSDSLGHAKPQGKLDIIKGILLDIFVCICF